MVRVAHCSLRTTCFDRGLGASRRTLTLLLRLAQSDGMTRVSGLLEPESAAVVDRRIRRGDLLAAARGGAAFVDPAAVRRAERIVNDERTTEQIGGDAFVGLLDPQSAAIAVAAYDGATLSRAAVRSSLRRPRSGSNGPNASSPSSAPPASPIDAFVELIARHARRPRWSARLPQSIFVTNHDLAA